VHRENRVKTLINVSVPDIGDFRDIPVIEILVKTGDRVNQEATLVVLESDKATLDVPSPVAGIVSEVKVGLGDKVSKGSILLNLEVGSTIEDPIPVPGADAAASLPPTAEPSANVVSLRVESPERTMQPSGALQRTPHASPSIRRISREFGIDLATVQGSGRRGRIRKEDLQNFVKSTLSAVPVTGNSAGDPGGVKVAPWPVVDFSKFGKIERTALSKIRKMSGANLARNSIVIPHVTNFDDADITDLDAFRRSLNEESKSPDVKMTILPFLIKAAAKTLAKFVAFNSSLDGDELILKAYIHIGFAADTPNGLVVPVIRDVDQKGIREIAAETSILAVQAREGKLRPADMQGGCFTISSLGGIGGTGFTPIINAPEVAILGVTRAKMQPVWNDSGFTPRLILPVSLSWDHRVVDGVGAARFLVYLTELLSDFRRVLL
jgi:pyruvate dehydrogenase E2 component (dihydrolipoamide acetyltransferase)